MTRPLAPVLLGAALFAAPAAAQDVTAEGVADLFAGLCLAPAAGPGSPTMSVPAPFAPTDGWMIFSGMPDRFWTNPEATIRFGTQDRADGARCEFVIDGAAFPPGGTETFRQRAEGAVRRVGAGRDTDDYAEDTPEGVPTYTWAGPRAGSDGRDMHTVEISALGDDGVMIRVVTK